MLKLISEYFVNSDQKLKAWFLLSSVILFTVLMTGLFAVIPMWFATFWIAIEAKNTAMILVSLNYFVALLLASSFVVAIKNYFEESLIINWRNWLTNSFINKYLSGKHNYLDLSRFADKVPNPAQRIQEDIKYFVDNTVSLGLELFSNIISLSYFTYSLWVVGGALSFAVFGMNIIIPGYLVWGALAFCLVTSGLTKFISRNLDKLNAQKFGFEDNFRQDIHILGNEAENVAQEHSEPYYKNRLAARLHRVINNAFKINIINSMLFAVQNFTMQLQTVFPYFIALPALFSGKIDMPLFMQTGLAFVQVSMALSWFQQSAYRLGLYRANIQRVSELEKALIDNVNESSDKSITIQNSTRSSIKLINLNITYPTNNQFLMQKLNLEFKQGEHTLIRGASGLGKSTLFKVISGSWQYGSGAVHLPKSTSMLYLTQKPIIPTDTLRAVLAYPQPADTYTDSQYKEALKAVGLSKFTQSLSQENSWAKQLSGGQQQRVAFARALLKKPDWIFMDETTASLDEASEAYLYNILRNRLPNATIISIAHRSTVEQYHKRVVTLSSWDGENSRIMVSEHQVKPVITRAHSLPRAVLKPQLFLANSSFETSDDAEKARYCLGL